MCMLILCRDGNIVRVLCGLLDRLFGGRRLGIWVLQGGIQCLFWDCMRVTNISGSLGRGSTFTNPQSMT